MKVLFIGPQQGRSFNEYLALKKIYKNVDLIEPYKSLPFQSISSKIFFHISPKLLEPIINKYFILKIKDKSYDLIYVRSGEFIGQKLISILKKYTKKIVIYCADNPFVARDKKRWDLLRPALKYYDLVVFQQFLRIKQAKKNNLKNIMFVYPSYTQKVHCPPKIGLKEKKKLQNDIIFIGTWFPSKGKFFKKLYDKGLKFKIYGPSWNKDKFFNQMKNRITLGHVYRKLYSKLIYCSKIAIGLTTKENMDDITDRTVEIPAIGTLLCTNKTKTHQKILIENKEAIFFKDAEECFQKCQKLLKNEKLIKKIALNGHVKVTQKLKLSTDEKIKKIVSKVFREK